MSGVLLGPVRPSVVRAKEAAGIDAVSGGRPRRGARAVPQRPPRQRRLSPQPPWIIVWKAHSPPRLIRMSA
ncbi:hypothetical protein [Streptomyces sp. NPDC058653]|uniref:hypothetical protein n=1 Tax=Streptomyces sp. NPDC058653 TaxID=3346576 RepID=UPI003648FB9C